MDKDLRRVLELLEAHNLAPTLIEVKPMTSPRRRRKGPLSCACTDGQLNLELEEVHAS